MNEHLVQHQGGEHIEICSANDISHFQNSYNIFLPNCTVILQNNEFNKHNVRITHLFFDAKTILYHVQSPSLKRKKSRLLENKVLIAKDINVKGMNQPHSTCLFKVAADYVLFITLTLL